MAVNIVKLQRIPKRRRVVKPGPGFLFARKSKGKVVSKDETPKGKVLVVKKPGKKSGKEDEDKD